MATNAPRDPDRITPALERLGEYWRANPDLRLGQIITNAAAVAGSTSTFYIEDDRLIGGLTALSARQAVEGDQ